MSCFHIIKLLIFSFAGQARSYFFIFCLIWVTNPIPAPVYNLVGRAELPTWKSNKVKLAIDLTKCDAVALNGKGEIRMDIRVLDITAMEPSPVVKGEKPKPAPSVRDFKKLNWQKNSIADASLDPIRSIKFIPFQFFWSIWEHISKTSLYLDAAFVLELAERLRLLGVQATGLYKANQGIISIFPQRMGLQAAASESPSEWDFEDV